MLEREGLERGVRERGGLESREGLERGVRERG